MSGTIISMAEHFAKRVTLTRGEAAFLQSFTGRSIRVRRRDFVERAGDPANHAFLLQEGWAVTSSDFADGTRQVRRLHFPGDLLAMPAMAMHHHPADIEAVTDVVIAPFNKQALATLIEHYPRLATIMFVFAQQERITSGDRLCSLSRLSCKGRMAFLLLDMLHRLRATDDRIDYSFEMHLTRAQMAEITGMTSVHASRTWSELIAEGVIASQGSVVSILDESHLLAMSGFIDRSANLDFSWLPGAAFASAPDRESPVALRL